MGSSPNEPGTVVLAEVREFPELQRAMRARAEQLQITRAALDDITGLASGYTAKLLCSPPMKNCGAVSLGPMLGGLGLMLLVVEDPIALAKVQRRLCLDNPRHTDRARNGNRNWETHRMTPMYRATEDNTNLGLGHWRKGQTFPWQGWPKCFAGAVEPANEAAKRVVEWWEKFRFDPHCPATAEIRKFCLQVGMIFRRSYFCPSCRK